MLSWNSSLELTLDIGRTTAGLEKREGAVAQRGIQLLAAGMVIAVAGRKDSFQIFGAEMGLCPFLWTLCRRGIHSIPRRRGCKVAGLHGR